MTGRISDERFTELSADYEAEQKELKERAAVLQGRTFKDAGSHGKRRGKLRRQEIEIHYYFIGNAELPD